MASIWAHVKGRPKKRVRINSNGTVGKNYRLFSIVPTKECCGDRGGLLTHIHLAMLLRPSGAVKEAICAKLGLPVDASNIHNHVKLSLSETTAAGSQFVTQPFQEAGTAIKADANVATCFLTHSLSCDLMLLTPFVSAGDIAADPSTPVAAIPIKVSEPPTLVVQCTA